MRLGEVIGRWIGKVEIVLAGADEDLREGEQALAAADPMRARAAAHRVLAVAPGSPLALALLADACEAAHLDAELALTLEELATRAPSSAEVWVRLARARRDTQAPTDEVRDALVRALAVATTGSDARRDALLALADLDLAHGDGTRAELWLERLGGSDTVPAVAVRRAEAKLLRGEAAAAKKLLDGWDASPADGRAALTRGRVLAATGDPAAFLPLIRAMVLDTPGASDALSAALASVPSDPQVRGRVRSVVDAKGEQDRTLWRAAFARAEGAVDAAKRALRDAVQGGDAAAARPLLEVAIDDRDGELLAVALGALRAADVDPLLADARLVASAASGGRVALDAVARVSHPRVLSWAEATARQVARSWIPPSGGPTDWPALLDRLDAHARALAHLESVAAIADLAAERSRPVRLAIVGEFNAGKSTFINALIGAEVAPTGVLPTTATLHHLRWAPDPFARIFFSSSGQPPERIVPLRDLRDALRTLDADTVSRVELLMPLEFLVRVEILDTPGFNAPDPRHTRVALRAFEEADIAIWLLDATQPFKESERAVLEGVRRERVPLQMLVNKADRLAAPDLERVMATVHDALTEAKITSWAPPLPLSAKKALAGKLGDVAALQGSGWAAAKALLEDQIVARHAELKERALRRRAGHIVARLATQASAQAEHWQQECEAVAAHARESGRAAATIERDAETVAAGVARSLEPSAQAWGRDLTMVFVGRDRESASRDAVLTRYRVERAVAAIAPPLERALASLAAPAEGGARGPSQLAPASRALVRATAEAIDPSDPMAILPPLARAAVATLVDHLFARSLAPRPTSEAAGLVRELAALAAALQAGD